MAFDCSRLNEKLIALVLTDTEDESVAFFGTLAWDGKSLVMKRGDGKSDFEIREEWRDRIEPVPEGEPKRILNNADFMLRLSVGPIPADEDQSEFEKTGLKWPD